MRRLLVQLDDKTYAHLKKQASKEKRSMASIVRESLQRTEPRRKLTISDFPWVGAGQSEQGDLAPVSENHDEALVDAIMSRWRK